MIFEFTRYAYIVKSRYCSDLKIKSLINKSFEVITDTITSARDVIIKVFRAIIARL